MGLRPTSRREYSQIRGMEVPRFMRTLATVFVFALATLVTASSASAAQVSTDYRIRPGDTLSVSVFGDATLSQPSLRVLPGGNISMPLAGAIPVGGLTPSRASDAVARALSRYLRHPQVTVAVVTPATLDVMVLGNVKTPGKNSLKSESRLTDAIAAAGGLGVTNGPLTE